MFNGPDLELTNTIPLALKMTSAQVVEMSVTNNSSFQNYSHPDDHNIQRKDPYKSNLLLLAHQNSPTETSDWLLDSGLCSPPSSTLSITASVSLHADEQDGAFF